MIKRTLLGLIVSCGAVVGYQMSNYTAPSYPVIIPAPQNLEHHGSSTDFILIDPCELNIIFNAPNNFDQRSLGYITAAIPAYLDKYIYINGKVCPKSADNAISALNITLTTNEKLMPDDLLDTNETYILVVDSKNITIVASQWSGVVRGLSTLA
jgi:hypothetical protein